MLKRWTLRISLLPTAGSRFKAIAGEVQSCTLEMTASWKESTLPTLLSNYALRHIFNADDFGLFYKALPDKSMHLKSEDCVGGKCKVKYA